MPRGDTGEQKVRLIREMQVEMEVHGFSQEQTGVIVTATLHRLSEILDSDARGFTLIFRPPKVKSEQWSMKKFGGVKDRA